MTVPLLYRPNQSWQIWAAFAGAVLLHVAAVAIAENHPREVLLPAGEDPGVWIEITPPVGGPVSPELPETPLPPPPLPTDDPMFRADEATPPPVRQPREARLQPLVRARVPGPSGLAKMGTARVLALSAPRPEYPYEARRQRMTGSGIALLTIDPTSGYVTEVSMARSTGSAVLDNATISGFRRWRFKPGTVTKVQSPITYTLTGASY